MNLRQIVDSVNETAYHGVIHALLSCKNHYKEWQRQHGRTITRVNQLLQTQRRRFACIQKQERGLYLLDAELKEQLKYEGVTPNCWILPSKMSIYCTMVPSAEVEYYRKGAGAAANLEKGPDNLLTFRGSKVFETRPFDIDFIGEPRDLLVREVQIGSYYVFPSQEEVGTGNSRDIYIYDMDQDDMVLLKYDDFAANAIAKDGDGSQVIVFRPFETYNMASGILMRGGLDTGFTAHGFHDFQLTDDIIAKTHIGHYSFYHKSIVKNPKNIILAENIFAHSYVQGEGAVPYTSAGEWTSDMSNERFKKDLITVAVGAGPISNPLDITGHFSPSVLNANNTELDDSQPHYPGADAIASALGFDRLQNYGDEEPFLSPLRHLNTVCFRGHQVQFDPKTKDFTKIKMNTGHWGPNVYRGCRSVRNGENAFLKDMEYEKVAGSI